MRAWWWLLCVSIGVQAQTVSSLSEVPAVIQTSEGQAFYAEQMGGVARAAPYGEWPEAWGASARSAFLSWLAPKESEATLVTLGAKRWQRDGLFVGAACFAPDQRHANEAKKMGETTCGTAYVGGESVPNRFYIGVFEMIEGVIKPLARLDGPAAVAHEGPEGEVRRPDAYNKLDLAPYRISADEVAIGVRAGLQVGYSGGGAYAEYLELYRVQGGALVNVFNGLVYEFSDIAGEWHADGTRAHDIDEAQWRVVMLPTQTQGFFDLQLRKGRERVTYVWSVQQSRYVLKE